MNWILAIVLAITATKEYVDRQDGALEAEIGTNTAAIAENRIQIATNAADIVTLKTGKQDVISDLQTIRSGAALGATALQEHQSLTNYFTKGESDGRYLHTETDPTVPSWAKADNKPTYAYSEISNTPDLGVYATTGQVAQALSGKLGNTGNQTLSGSLIIDRDAPDGDAWLQTKRGDTNGLAIALYGFTIDGHFQALPYASGILALLSDVYTAVQQIAPAFTRKMYVVNNLCTYNGVVYRCKSGYTATASSLKPDSDTTHWEAKMVSELFAPLASPAFTGTPIAPHLTDQSADGQVANKKYVDDKVAGVSVTPLSGQTFDFATMQGIFAGVKACIEALGGSVTNFPAIPANE